MKQGFMKRTGFLVSVFLLALPVVAVAGSSPKITFDKETLDYGRVLYGDTVTEEFIVTNSGDAPLIIDKVEATCGCTKAIKGSSEVPPNGTTKIVAAFDTTGLQPGRKQKAIHVHSNDPQRPEVKLTLYADVIRELNPDPPGLHARLPRFVEAVKFPIKMTNASDKTVKIRGVKVQGQSVAVVLEPETVVVQPQTSAPFTVIMRLQAEGERPAYLGKVTLFTDHPKETEIDFRYLIQFEQGK